MAGPARESRMERYSTSPQSNIPMTEPHLSHTQSDAMLNHFLADGFEGLPGAIGLLINAAMKIERSQHLQATANERTANERTANERTAQRPAPSAQRQPPTANRQPSYLTFPNLPRNFLQIRFGLDMLRPSVLKDCPSITLNPNPTKNMLPAKMDIPTPLLA